MNPAPSIILFTTASGAGYGLMAFAALGALLGWVPVTSASGLAFLLPGLTLVTGGLLASAAHLGHPERAWRAVSQWRSSWLSREAVVALLTYLPALGLAWVWIATERASPPLAVLAAIMSALTVLCTAMIYASLKPVPRWSHPLVPAVYLSLAGASGSAIGIAIAAWLAAPIEHLAPVVAILTVAAWALKWRYWQSIDRAAQPLTTAAAIGVGERGTARLLELPHTERNYILDEMGFRLARKHAVKLRRWSFAAGLAIPLLAVFGALLTSGQVAATILTVGAAFALLAVAIERWLFFAEAEHIVMLYYGRDAA